MTYKPFAYIAAIIVFIITFSGCANIVAPTGGPRDSLPPVLISVSPLDSSRNFTGNRIYFTFNEYVEIQEIQQNLMVSPIPKTNPTIEFKFRTVTIKLKDTLEENTTYAINLGNALRDINEGNIYKDFTYVFSTGDSLDLNTYKGRVLLAETGKPDSTLIAILHRKGEDSAVAKERPRYYARLDSSGNFNFQFLAPGTYYLYALKDEGGMKTYTSKTQLFAFADSAINIPSAAAPLTLYAFNEEEEEEPKKPTGRPTPAKPKKEEDKRLKFQLSLDNNTQDLLTPLTITFNDPLKSFDSSKLAFTDDKFTRITNYTITPDTSNKVYTLNYAWKENTDYHLILDKEFASDSLDRQLLKTDTIDFKSKRNADYGTLRIRFPNVDLSKKPILQLIQNDKVIFSSSLTEKKDFYTKLFQPGDYEIRVLYDTNGNGVWDTGSFFEARRQPERAESMLKKLTVRPNWDNEQIINL